MAALYGSSNNPIIEMLIGGVWTDVTSRVRGQQQVSITRGRANEQSGVSPQRANFVVENQDAYFSTRTPSSVNFRRIGKNTQVRIRAGAGDNYMRTLHNDATDLAGASTTDKASLDITGDTDARAEIWPHSWRPRAPITVVCKYDTIGNQRSWLLRIMESGRLHLWWTTDGTSGTILTAESSAAVPVTAGRIAVRFTIDVDNGAAGRTITFYTAPSIDGTWTQLGTAQVQAGVTSIFAGTAPLTIGRGASLPAPVSGSTDFGGKFYAFQLRNGIAGTLVANFDPRARSLGDTTWADAVAAPNTWTLAGAGVRITSDRVRFWGELASLPKEWDATKVDSIVAVQAAGMLRRLTQGAKPIESAMVRNFRGVRSFAWWPLEDGSTATRASNMAQGSSPYATVYPGVVTDVRFGDSASPPGAASSMAFQSSASRFNAKIELFEQFAPATYSVVFYIKTESLPTTDKPFAVIRFSGQITRAEISVSTTQWRIDFYDIIENVVATQTVSVSLVNPINGWVGYNLVLKDSGANMTYTQRWDTIGTFGGGVGPTTIVGKSAPPPSNVYFTGANDPAYTSMKISHIFVSDSEIDLSNPTYRDASNAYRGETAVARQTRLATEEGVTIEITGNAADSEAMGFQTIATLPELLAECWDVDGGIGGEARDALVLEYRTRADLDQRDDAVFSHLLQDLAEPPRPTDDDQGFTNDVTITREGGGSARALVTEGYTSINEPPAGVGRYATEKTLNLAYDEDVADAAGWAALTGSWDQDRYPSLAMALHRRRVLADDTLFNNTMGLNLGDTAALVSLPSWMPPEEIGELVVGYSEQLSRFLWTIDMNCAPAGPYWSVGQLGRTDREMRLDGTTHTHSNALTTTGTSVTLVTATGSTRWVDSAGYAAEFPFDIVINGEVMRVTTISGTTSPQTATVTRSVNGVVKSHTAGSLVRILRPYYLGR